MVDQEDGLVARFSRDDDGTGELAVDVRFRDFSGSSAAWFHEHELLAFTDQLCGFPLAEDDPVRVAGGYWSQERSGELAEEHVSLSVLPSGRRGQLEVTAHVATPSDYGRLGAVDARVVLPTTYEALRRFAGELRLVVRGQAPEARLDVEELA